MLSRSMTALGALVLLAAAGVHAADWSQQGAGAGLSKYTPDNVSADATLRPAYTKRFYGKWAAYTGNTCYGSAVVTRGGRAAILADDRANSPVADKHVLTIFDWATGGGQAYYPTLFSINHHAREIDSHHFTLPVIWHADGRIYFRRGGDLNATYVFLPAAGTFIRIFGRSETKLVEGAGVDNNGFLQIHGDLLLVRHGDTRTTREYQAGWISEACFVNPNSSAEPVVLGQRIAWVGPSIPATAGPDGLYGSTGRYGDIPKVAQNVCVMAGLAYSSLEPYPNNTKVWLQATDLTTAQTLWTRTWTSDAGGYQGFYTSISDYWRFIATDDGHYVFFTRAPGQPVTLRVLDLRTGIEKRSRPLANSQERPLLAAHGGALYVIGRAEQFKMDIATGDQIWRQTHSFPYDRGYRLTNYEYDSPMTQDPLYRPAVLTDDTLWFIQGETPTTPTVATLVGIRTSDGQIIKQIDLRDLYTANPNESVQVVNDLVVANRHLGVLVGVKDANSPHAASNGMDYQDLHVFKVIPSADIDGDGDVDVFDVIAVINAFGSVPGDANWNADCDFDSNGRVDIFDVATVVNHFGQGT